MDGTAEEHVDNVLQAGAEVYEFTVEHPDSKDAETAMEFLCDRYDTACLIEKQLASAGLRVLD